MSTFSLAAAEEYEECYRFYDKHGIESVSKKAESPSLESCISGVYSVPLSLRMNDTLV